MKETILVTRPVLAVKLYGAGKEVSTVTNPYRADLKAWVVALDAETCSIISSYYAEIGKPVPKAVARFMEGGDGHAL